MEERESIRQVKERHKESILQKPNVVGLGTGYKVRGKVRTDILGVVVLVRQKVPRVGLEPSELVPSELDGVETDVVQVGDLRSLQSPTDRWRPAPGGVSLGHYKITAGTLGTVVRDRDSGARLILSNNHVLANSNEADLGDLILQPGPVDGGTVKDDTIARLERFCRITFSVAPSDCSIAVGISQAANAAARLLGSQQRLQAFRTDQESSNLVDAAAARPVEDQGILDDILNIGTVQGTLPATLGMNVRKSGRTTGLSTGEVSVLDATVNISYGPGRMARFEEQIVTSAMSEGGDSGSLLVAADSKQAVGLLFGGSDQATIHNPIQAVLDCLNVMI
jgi:hypothetical protein